MRRFPLLLTLSALTAGTLLVHGEIRLSKEAKKSKPPKPATPRFVKPRVYTPSTAQRPSRSYFPWKRRIPATIFWVGERPTAANPTPNWASSWDPKWASNFGGYDDPNKANRVGYRPKSFVPNQNPFYVALPYNDVTRGRTKPEARRVIPWFKSRFKKEGRTVLKGQWLVIRHKNRICFAQWEDCGPFVTDDWQYVFGNARPKNLKNKGAGIDLSPAVRDHLKLKSGDVVDWRFVNLSEVRNGPWKMLGNNNQFAQNRTPPKPKIEQLYEQRQKWLERGGSATTRGGS